MLRRELAFAGSVSINVVKNDTYSTVKNATITAEEISSLATDTAITVVVAGAASYGGTAGIGGAIAFNSIFSDTISEVVDNSVVTYDNRLKLDADSTGILVSVAGAIAGSKKFGFAGTLAVTMAITDTIAQIQNSDIDNTVVDSLLSMEAINDSIIVAISGAVGLGGNAGIGVAIAFNMLDNDVTALIKDSDVEVDGDIELLASEDGNIEAITAGGAGAEKAAIAGAISANVTANDVKAAIEGSMIDSLGSLKIDAKQSTAIHALTGNAAGAGKVAIGASIGLNVVVNTTKAFIENSVVTVEEHVLLDANNSSQLIALAVGGQGAGNVAIGGSVVLGYVQSTTEALYQGDWL